ncbi:MAG: hypothetical protein HFACDABA_02474 [Anaerolineales bacterium]|nr:hypothetical protein [Anaerolineales bacterium]
MKRIFLTMLLLLISCTTEDTLSPVDNPIFTESSCALPCWYGITVGKTTREELFDVLDGMSLVNQDSITLTESVVLYDEHVYFTMGKGTKFLEVEGSDPVSQDYLWTGQIDILNGKVMRLVLSGGLGLTMQDVVDIFGTPSYVIPYFTRGGSNIEVELISPTRGVDFSCRLADLESELTPDTKIGVLTIFEAELYSDMVENKQFMFAIIRAPNDLEKYAWKGYGKIVDYWYVR